MKSKLVIILSFFFIAFAVTGCKPLQNNNKYDTQTQSESHSQLFDNNQFPDADYSGHNQSATDIKNENASDAGSVDSFLNSATENDRQTASQSQSKPNCSYGGITLPDDEW